MVGAADTNGQRQVTVTDPVNGSSQGFLSDIRGSVRLEDGRVVYSGDFDGQRLNPLLNEGNLHTIDANLDITGNLLSFGALLGDSSVAGVTFQFLDQAGVATLHTSLARPLAEWVWSKSGLEPSDPLETVMKLDKDHALTLIDPATGLPGIVLDPRPDGVSSIKGVLRVMPAGDISMGEFDEGPQP